MHELKFAAAWFDPDEEAVPPIAEPIGGMVATFTESFRHSCSLMRLLPAVVGIGMRYQLVAPEAKEIIRKRYGLGPDAPFSFTQENEVHNEQRKMVGQMQAVDMAHPEIGDRAIQQFYQVTDMILDRYGLTIRQPNTPSPVWAMLSFMLQSGWTAFEVLSRRILALEFPKWQDAQRLETLCGAFKDFHDLDTSLAIGDQSLVGLYHLRNLLAHRNGVVDQPFKDRCKEDGFCQWASLPVHADFPLDGEVVGCYLGRSFRQGVKLAIAVDCWRSNKP